MFGSADKRVQNRPWGKLWGKVRSDERSFQGLAKDPDLPRFVCEKPRLRSRRRANTPRGLTTFPVRALSDPGNLVVWQMARDLE